MSYLAEAHADWHAVNGRDAVCPLDCGIGEGLIDAMQEEYYARNPIVPDPWEGTDIELRPWEDDPSPYFGTYSEE